jgi:hypothetical protein
MLKLNVVNEESEDVVAIQLFLNWQKILFETYFNPDEVRHLNQGNNTPLLMENNMIMARGFFEIVNFIKLEGYGFK